jgi:molybdenum cofactor biosynthesis protein A
MKEPLIDTFGRKHDYLRISLTERCNLRCFYCMPAEGVNLTPKNHLMNQDEVVEMAKIFVGLGVKKIRLTGGEPLVRKDAKEIIQRLAELPVQLAITTNGILVDQYLNIFKESGLRSINVSLDSLQEDKVKKITLRNFFPRILGNIDLLINEGIHVKVNAVAIKGTNDDEILDFIEWTKEKPIHVRFIEFMPFDGNNWDWSKGISYKEILVMAQKAYGEDVERLKDSLNDTAKNFRIKGYKGTFAIISSVTNPFCDTCNRLRLTADGKIKNCLFSNQETDLLSALRAGEDVEHLIRQSVINKKAKRAGMDSFEQFANPDNNQENRSMIKIGG